MTTLVAVLGSVTRPGRLRQAVELLLADARQERPDLVVDLLDLAAYRVSFADGRPLDAYGDDTARVVGRVVAADICLLATPIYRASYSGALKNLLDLVPLEGLRGKVCGLMAMGATAHHYLALDAQLRPVLAWFGAHLVPGGVYLQSEHFREGRLADERARGELTALARAMLALHDAVAGRDAAAGPPPLAARGGA
jgi:NAD(P)H-dependent FMN reductase